MLQKEYSEQKRRARERRHRRQTADDTGYTPPEVFRHETAAPKERSVK